MNLVVQGPALTREQVQELAGAVETTAVETITPHAFRLKKVPAQVEIGEWCEARKIDHAWLAERRRFADLKLLAMDMDSTLITIECIDELGDLAGKKAEVAAITAQAMRGEIEYPESLRRRVGLLAGLQEAELQRVYQQSVLRRAPQGAPEPRLHPLQHPRNCPRPAHRQAGRQHRRRRRQGREIRFCLEGPSRRQGTKRRHRRRRQRSQDDGRGRLVGRFSCQAGGARAGELRHQLVGPRRGGESLRMTSATRS
jgi:hypothetical protein